MEKQAQNGTKPQAQEAPQPSAPAAIQPQQPRVPIAFVPENMDDALRLARMFCAADALLPEALRGKPECVVLVMLMGKEFGMSPVQSLRHVHVVKGKPQLSSAFKIGLVRQSPDCEYIKCVESTDTSATWESKRKSEATPNRCTFTIDDAKAAGLLSGGPSSPWQTYRRRMLVWRAGGELTDREWSEITGNIGTMDPGDPDPGDRSTFLERVVPEGVTAPPPPLSAQAGLPQQPAAQTSPPPDVDAKSSSQADASSAPVAEVVPSKESKPMAVEDAPADPIDVEVATIRKGLAEAPNRREAQKLIPRIQALPAQERLEMTRAYEDAVRKLPAR